MSAGAVHRDQTPWYRQFWPWALMAGPAAVIVAGGVTVWLTVRSPDALVVDDYYKAGQAINLSLKRDARANELGLSAQMQFASPSGGELKLEMTSTQSVAWPPVIQLLLTHPVREEFDRKVDLRIVRADATSASYLGSVDLLEKIAYQATLQDYGNNWRLISTKRGAAHSTMRLLPGNTKTSPATEGPDAGQDKTGAPKGA